MALIEGSDGALYGTTKNQSCNSGTIFKLNKNGSDYAVLHSFEGCFDYPPLSVMQGSDGALYGTKSTGGIPGTNGLGAVFRLNEDGSGYTVLHAFTNFIDGYDPVGLIQGSDGALYGTSSGNDSIFKLNRDGSAYTILHVFPGNDGDGTALRAGLLEGSDGALYGTTISGGANDEGTVFRINKDGSGYLTLSNGGGGTPLIEGSDGALYGSTITRGARLFKLNKDGTGYAVLHNFEYSPRDVLPVRPNGLVEGTDGALYGTTRNDGEFGLGTVFKLFASTPVVAITRLELSGAGARLSFSGGAADQPFRIEAKTDLTLWQTIGTHQFGIDGKFLFLDTSASNYPIRFYRSATP